MALCASAEFIRVPARSDHPLATVKGLTAEYSASELSPVPLAAQLMGSSTELLAAAAKHLVEAKGAPRIDLNCGEYMVLQQNCRAHTPVGSTAGVCVCVLDECVLRFL
jgi:tRNA-dihydrouridine synthase C